MKSLLTVFVILAGIQVTAIAQEEFRALDGSLLRNTTPLLDKADGYDELSMGLRIPFLGGKFDNQGDKWSDIYHSTGFGFGMDGSYLWTVSDKVAVGAYVAWSLDVLTGASQTVAEAGGPVTVTYDDLVMIRFLVGARIRETFGRFFMDQNIGFGFALYPSTNASSGGQSVGFIDSTAAFAFELGFRWGFVVSPVVDLGMSFSYNYNGAPNISSDISGVDPTLRYDPQSNFVLGFFINLNF